MQDPNEDTQWNDVLRAKGIIPEKPKEKEVNEDEIIAMMEKTIVDKSKEGWFYCRLSNLAVENQIFLSLNIPFIFHCRKKHERYELG